MITEKSKLFEGVVPPPLRLSGQDGNAFMVMGLARRAAKKDGWSQAMIDEYISQATSGDYDHLLAVTMEYFDVT